MKKRFLSLILAIVLLCISAPFASADTVYTKTDLQTLYDTVANYIFRSEEILASTLTEDEDALCARTIIISKAALLSPSFPQEHFDAVYRGLYDAFSMMSLVSQRNNSLTNPKVLRLLKALISLIVNDDYYEIAPPEDCESVAQTVNKSLEYINDPTSYNPEDMYAQMNQLFICLRNASEYKLTLFNAKYGVYVFNDVRENDWFFSAVKYVFNNGLFNGTSENEFSPSLQMTRGMFITVLSRFAEATAPDTPSPFTDVPADAYYADAVNWAYAGGILSWTEGENFYPDSPITREEMVTSIYNYIIDTAV